MALDYGLKKFSRFLHQGPFTVRLDNSTVIHRETMNADEKVSPCCEKVVGELLPDQHEAGPHARQIYPSRPSAVGSELNSSVDFEPRNPLPHPLDKIDKILFNRICRQREAGRASFLRNGSECAESGRICLEQPPLRDNDKFHSLGGHRIIQPSRPTIYLLPRYKGQMHL